MIGCRASLYHHGLQRVRYSTADRHEAISVAVGELARLLDNVDSSIPDAALR